MKRPPTMELVRYLQDQVGLDLRAAYQTVIEGTSEARWYYRMFLWLIRAKVSRDGDYEITVKRMFGKIFLTVARKNRRVIW